MVGEQSSERTQTATLVIRSEPREVDEILQTGVIELQREFAPVVDRAKEVSNAIFENSQMAALGEISTILGVMSGQLKRLSPRNGPWYRRGFQILPDIWERTKWGIKKAIIARKEIKTFLEEQSATLKTKQENLEKNIEDVVALKGSAEAVSRSLSKLISRLTVEKEIIERLMQTWTSPEEVGKVHAARMVVLRFESVINDLNGIAALHDATVERCSMQQQVREALYMKMVNVGSQMDILLAQQLAEYLRLLEVRAATSALEDYTDGINRVAQENARLSRSESARAMKVAYSPVVTKKTIDVTVGNIIGMLTDTHKAVNKAVEEGRQVAQVAATQQSRIDETKRKIIEGKLDKDEKESRNEK